MIVRGADGRLRYPAILIDKLKGYEIPHVLDRPVRNIDVPIIEPYSPGHGPRFGALTFRRTRWNDLHGRRIFAPKCTGFIDRDCGCPYCQPDLWAPLAPPPKDDDFTRRVAKLFGVPPRMLGVVGSHEEDGDA